MNIYNRFHHVTNQYVKSKNQELSSQSIPLRVCSTISENFQAPFDHSLAVSARETLFQIIFNLSSARGLSGFTFDLLSFRFRYDHGFWIFLISGV